MQSTFIGYDIRKPIENLPFTPTEDDVIFNFAAVHRTPGHEDHECFETNIRGAENVVAFAEKWNIKKIVFISSIAPYGAAEQLKKETTLPTPNTAYGISKLVAEKIHEKWQNGDASIVSLLLFVLVWYSERVRMVTSPDCIGLSVVISLLTLAERILLRLASM